MLPNISVAIIPIRINPVALIVTVLFGLYNRLETMLGMQWKIHVAIDRWIM